MLTGIYLLFAFNTQIGMEIEARCFAQLYRKLAPTLVEIAALPNSMIQSPLLSTISKMTNGKIPKIRISNRLPIGLG